MSLGAQRVLAVSYHFRFMMTPMREYAQAHGKSQLSVLIMTLLNPISTGCESGYLRVLGRRPKRRASLIKRLLCAPVLFFLNLHKKAREVRIVTAVALQIGCSLVGARNLPRNILLHFYRLCVELQRNGND